MIIDIQTQELVLEKIKFKSQFKIPYKHSTKHEMCLDATFNSHTLNIETNIIGRQSEGLVEVVEFESPSSWWQHLKQAIGFSNIRMKRETREVKWKQMALFPDINPSYADQHRILTYIEKK